MRISCSRGPSPQHKDPCVCLFSGPLELTLVVRVIKQPSSLGLPALHVLLHASFLNFRALVFKPCRVLAVAADLDMACLQEPLDYVCVNRFPFL